MRSLQLKRFNIIFSTPTIAKDNIESIKEHLLDGEPQVAAYYTDGTKANVAYLIGIKAKKDGVDTMFYMDCNDLDNRMADIEEWQRGIVEELNFATAVTQKTADTYTTETTDTYHVERSGDEDESDFRLMFTPVSPDASKVPYTIGDIEAGTTAATLKQYTLSKLLDDIIFKTQYPTITENPKTKLTSSASLVKLGATVTLSTNYTNGKARVVLEGQSTTVTAYTSTAATCTITYSGAESGTAATLENVTTTTATTTFTTNKVGTYTFVNTAAYEAGDILHDSKNGTGDTSGNIKVYTSSTATSTTSVPNPHPSGNVTASATVNVSIPLYVNSSTTQSTTTMSELPLKTWTSTTWMQIPVRDVADGGNELLLEIPQEKNLVKVAVLNPLKPDTEEASYDTTVTMVEDGTTTHEFNGIAKTYKKFKSTTGANPFLGDFKYLIKIS